MIIAATYYAVDYCTSKRSRARKLGCHLLAACSVLHARHSTSCEELQQQMQENVRQAARRAHVGGSWQLDGACAACQTMMLMTCRRQGTRSAAGALARLARPSLQRSLGGERTHKTSCRAFGNCPANSFRPVRGVDAYCCQRLMYVQGWNFEN
jgi:hypothetical protein